MVPNRAKHLTFEVVGLRKADLGYFNSSWYILSYFLKFEILKILMS